MKAPAGTIDAKAQPGLFVMWHKSRREEKRIMEDLARHFEILSVQEVHWTPDLFERNYERFYSDLAVRGARHVFNKGTGPFLAIRVVDRQPAIGDRMTSRGVRTVNGRFLDAKLRYRDWLGGIGVHCGETIFETRRDMRMLLGVDADLGPAGTPPWNGDVEVLQRDVSGARGWDSVREAMSALNVGVTYAVIGGPASPGATSLTGGARPAQILTNHYHALHTILNARPVLGSPPTPGGSFRVTIGGRRTVVGVRRIGDGFLHPRLAMHCLSSRVLDDHGVYRACPEDLFATFAWHAAVHSPRLDDRDIAGLAGMAETLGITGWSEADLADPRNIGRRLGELMRKRNITPVTPRDPTVFVNFSVLGAGRPLAGRVGRTSRRWCYMLVRGTVGHTKARYWGTRGWILRRAPGLKRLKAAVLRLVR